MNPTDAFAWLGIGCNCLLLLILGLILALWALSPRVEGSYRERPQRDRTGDRRKRAPAAPPRQERPAVERARPTRAAAPKPTTLLSTALAEAQKAAEAIGDIQITIPTMSGTEFEVKLPDVSIGGEDPWAQVRSMQVSLEEKTKAVAEAGARAAVEQAAQRVEQAVPAAQPVTQRVKAAAQQSLNPLAAPTLADGIEIILQDLIRREAEPLHQAIHVESTESGGVRILVGDRIYFSVSEMPEGRVKGLLQQAVQHWNKLWQDRDRNTR